MVVFESKFTEVLSWESRWQSFYDNDCVFVVRFVFITMNVVVWAVVKTHKLKRNQFDNKYSSTDIQNAWLYNPFLRPWDYLFFVIYINNKNNPIWVNQSVLYLNKTQHSADHVHNCCGICYYWSENVILGNFHHWRWHWKLLFWQLPVQPVHEWCIVASHIMSCIMSRRQNAVSSETTTFQCALKISWHE